MSWNRVSRISRSIGGCGPPSTVVASVGPGPLPAALAPLPSRDVGTNEDHRRRLGAAFGGADSGRTARRKRPVRQSSQNKTTTGKDGTTMNTTTTRTELTSHVRSGELASARPCWCGQELDRSRSRFCPRCGSASRPGTPVAFSLHAS